jgi:tyrosine-protein kinase Etk/Wzc
MMPENTTITFPDLWLILRRSKFKIGVWAAIFTVAVCLMILIRPPLYMAEASFREKSKTQTETSKNLSLALILGNQEGSENAAISLMKSRKLLERTILELGWQAQVKKAGISFSWIINSIDNLKVEWDFLTNSMAPSLSEDPSPFTVKEILFGQEAPLNLRLRFTTQGTFRVLDQNGLEIGMGKIGESFKNKQFSFKVISRDNEKSLNSLEYSLKLIPMKVIVEKLLKNMQIWVDNNDKSLLRLKYYNQNRGHASAFLNTLMAVYIEYLKDEQQRIADEQINYLHKRQDNEAVKLKKILEEHAQALSSNMATMESLSSTQQNYTQRLLLIDLELARLKRSHEEGLVYYDKYADGADTDVINHILGEIRSHKQQADTIDVALRQGRSEDVRVKSAIFAKQMEEIGTIQKNSSDAKNILAAVEQGKSLPVEGPLFQNPKYTIKDWIQALQKPSKEGKDDCEKKFKVYLANMLHLFDVEEKLANERLTHQQNIQPEFQGIDLSAANQLYMSYSQGLNGIEADIVHHEFIIDQMKDQTFEPSSLSSFLTDPVSQDIIIKSSNHVLRLKDQMNRSQKELDRIKEDLDQQRNFLLMHVKQMLQLLQLREKLFKEKILAIQNMQLELIHQKVSVLEKHLNDYISSRIINFKQEKSSLEQQRLSLKQEMEKMPNKWASEKLIDLHLEMSQKMIEELSKLVESKNIATHLDVTQSAPLDKALPPTHPQNPNLILFALLGSFVGSFVYCGFLLLKTAYKGMPATARNLKMLGGYVAGPLSKNYRANEILPDADLETLRCLSTHLSSAKKEKKEGQNLVLMVSTGVDYSDHFSRLLAKNGSRILYLGGSQKSGGLWPYLEGKTTTYDICKGDAYDSIVLGENSRFSNDLLTGKRFKEFIQNIKPHYDWMVFVSKCPPTSGEGKMLLNAFDYSVISVTTETVPELADILKPNVTFIID